MANSVVQTIKDAEIDARSLSEFVTEDADFVVSRRLAPTIHTLEYYLQTLNSVDKLAQQAQSAISATVDEVTRLEPRVVQMVNDAIDATAIPEGLVDTLVTVTKTTGNAIARSQSSLNSDYINVKNYGAKGDGITDDTMAFENAIADAPAGSTIYAPQGKYRLTSGLQWKTKLSLKGAGVGSTILYMDGVLFNAIVCVDGRPSSGLNPDGTPFDEPLEDCHFEDFEIDGSGLTHPEASVGGKGIFILFMRRALFRNLYIHHTIGTGLGCDFLEDSVIDSCNVSYCGRNRGLGIISVGQSGIGIGTGWQSKENVVVSNCVTNHNGNFGVFVELQTGSLDRDFTPNGAVFVNCYAEGNRVGFCNKASGTTLMSNCYALKNKTSGFITTSTVGAYNTIIGCRSEDNTDNGFSIAYGGGLDSLSDCVSINNGKVGYSILTETDGVGYLSGNGVSLSNCIAYNNTKESVKIVANANALEHGFYRIDSCLLLSAGDYGVYATGIKNLKISNSIISKNGSTGIRVLSAASNSDIDIQSNKVFGNVGNGVHLTITQSAYTKVSDNTITDNTVSGVVIGGANTFAMINNNIIGNYDESKLQGISLIIVDAQGGQYSVFNNTLGLNSSATAYNLRSGALATFRGNAGVGSGRPSTLQMTGSPYTLPKKDFDCMYYFSSSEPVTAKFGSYEVASGNSVSILVPANTEDVTVEYTSSVNARIQSH